MALATLAEAYRVKEEVLTPARIRIYEKALKNIPVALLAPMVDRCIDHRKGYRDIPPVAELREDAEWARQDILRRHPWTPCASCELTPGFCEVLIDGVTRLKRCPCRDAYMARLEQLGAGQTLALSEPSEMRQIAGGTE
jgi:hypothetical protein